jgi:hypothetical protein
MSLTRMKRLVVITALALGAIGSTVIPASASTAQAAAVRPASNSDTLYQCNWVVKTSNIGVWRYPGGSSRAGNVLYVRVGQGPVFISNPQIYSGVTASQKWVYGQLNVPAAGSTYPYYGWIGVDYLSQQFCGYVTEQTSNDVMAVGNNGDPFSSEPSMTSNPFRGQKWVYGEDPYVSQKAGWVGVDYLTKTGCTSSGCFYKIKGNGIHLWLYPGGSSGA